MNKKYAKHFLSVRDYYRARAVMIVLFLIAPSLAALLIYLLWERANR